MIFSVQIPHQIFFQNFVTHCVTGRWFSFTPFADDLTTCLIDTCAFDVVLNAHIEGTSLVDVLRGKDLFVDTESEPSYCPVYSCHWLCKHNKRAPFL